MFRWNSIINDIGLYCNTILELYHLPDVVVASVAAVVGASAEIEDDVWFKILQPLKYPK